MSRMSRAMSPTALVLSILALVVATSAGTAYAAIKIGTSNIENGAVTSPKIKNGTVKGKDVRNETLTGAKIANGSLGLADLSTATRRGLQVRAYATVDPGSPSLVAGTTRGFTAVTRPSTGAYCLTLDPALGIDVSKVSVQVTPEWGLSSGDTLQPYWFRGTDTCGAGKINVYTEQAGVSSDNVAFSVLVP